MTPLKMPSLPTRSGRLALAKAGLAGLLLVAVLAAPLAGCGGNDYKPPIPEPERWSADVVQAWMRVPVQDDGRVKPFLSWANFTLLGLNHKRSCKDPWDRKLSGVEWALDVMFRPEIARHYECFRVEDDAVLDAIGVAHEGKKKADRYSYTHLSSGLRELQQRTEEIRARKDKDKLKESDLPRVEQATLTLAHQVALYQRVQTTLDLVRFSFPIPAESGLRETFGGRERVGAAEILPQSAELLAWARSQDPNSLQGSEKARYMAVQGMIEGFFEHAMRSRAVRLLPPTETSADVEAPFDATDIAWMTPADAVERFFVGLSPDGPLAAEPKPIHIEMLGDLAAMTTTMNDPSAFQRHVEEFQARGRTLAIARGEYEKIEMEVSYYKFDAFMKALVAFILAFVLVAVSWLRPQKWLEIGAWAISGIGVLLVIYGITVRCLLLERPPVATLYETVLFVTVFFVIGLLVAEVINRKRIALALAPLLGALGLFVAMRYELVDRQDTMRPLVAVLRTNFWLATHVTCITIGYSAALLTGAVGILYVVGKALGFKRDDAAYYTTLNRMLYGMLAFGLIFATVGTILGGIWANDSWGRFWGWDPKENGALMIVLFQLSMVHGRLGGYLKPFGMAMASIVLAGIVAFSWWGVNLLSIGLHSYGFAQGVATGLFIFYGILAAALLIGAVWWVSQNAPHDDLGAGDSAA